MANSSIGSAFTFGVVSSTGDTVFTASVPTTDNVNGGWSSTFTSTRKLSFTVTTPGSYAVRLYDGSSNQVAQSQTFLIQDASDTYRPLLSNSLFFFKAQRDGPNVDTTVMQR
jgi:hypothetical protein